MSKCQSQMQDRIMQEMRTLSERQKKLENGVRRLTQTLSTTTVAEEDSDDPAQDNHGPSPGLSSAPSPGPTLEPSNEPTQRPSNEPSTGPSTGQTALQSWFDESGIPKTAMKSLLNTFGDREVPPNGISAQQPVCEKHDCYCVRSRVNVMEKNINDRVDKLESFVQTQNATINSLFGNTRRYAPL